MSDAVISRADTQERLSLAYAMAIAAKAKYLASVPELDRDSVDLTISAGGRMRPKLDLQLKATINLKKDGDVFKYALPIKNYNDLRERAQTPRILVVLDMPKSQREWMSLTKEGLTLRKSAYWANLSELPPTTNKKSVTICVPVKNRFNVPSLRALMEESRDGELSR